MARLVLFFALLPAVASAALPWLDGEWRREIGARAVSRFVHHGVERAAGSWQPGAWLVHERLRLGTWTSFPAGGGRNHEFIIVAAGRHEWDGRRALEVEIAHHHLRDAPDGHPNQTAELAVVLSTRAGPGRGSVAFVRDVKRRGDLLRFAYAGEQALTRIGAFLHYRLEVGAMDARNILPNLPGPSVADSYAYASLWVEVPYRIAAAWIVTAGASGSVTKGQRPFWSPTGAHAGPKAAVSLGVAFEF